MRYAAPYVRREFAFRIYGKVIAGKGSGGNKSNGKSFVIELNADALASIIKFAKEQEVKS